MTEQEMHEKKRRRIAEMEAAEKKVDAQRGEVRAIARQLEETVDLLNRFARNPAEKSATLVPLSAHVKATYAALPPATEVAQAIEQMVREYRLMEEIRADVGKL